MSPYFVELGPQSLWYLLEGAGRTLWLGIWAIALGTILGILLGCIRTYSRVGAILLAPLIDITRSVPLIIQIVLINSALGISGFFWGPFVVGVLVLGVYTASYTSEVVRSGLQAVPDVTKRAGRALGLTGLQNFVFIIAPIAGRIAFPGWINVVLGSLKDTSLVAVIGYVELLRASQIVITQTQEALIVLAVAGGIYFVMCFAISAVAKRVETMQR
ncbi:amino acid ABC transporter permease [Acuticoccus sp. M5D2P5]|uniref:amino acid ABC transporter permease n=1 Tax=Acuticoccus kalidii TaxID=2910977 RepID=UPI001F214FCE|nr:amino acid ABC transporter permease [Acuticoccus kalidii]MCF3934795.1 amino acid ABC transporter permease [Acuticoccus kalidii]